MPTCGNNEKPLFIEVMSLCKSFSRKGKIFHALTDINLQVFKGDIFGIIGPSGAGKSTLIRSLSGLLSPTSGKVCVEGVDITQFDATKLRSFRQKSGMIFQHFNLFSSRTVGENVAYPLEIAGVAKDIQQQRIDELLGLVGLYGKKFAYPSSLSGGEKQRVGIARALAHNPDILFCDEATSALDPRTTREILDLLRKINESRGITIILITHDMEVIKRICHRVAVVVHGKVIEEREVCDLFFNPQESLTKHFIQSASHELPKEFLFPPSETRKLLRLKFKGDAAGEPIISEMIKKFHVDANILLGWIDHVQSTIIGTLVIELRGEADNISAATLFLSEKSIYYDTLEPYAV